MAGDWIKWVKGLTKKREIAIIARAMGISRHEAAARCMEVWEWAGDQTINGVVPGVGLELVDGLTLPGFGAAMLAAGWLHADDDGIVIPNWTRHNDHSAKQRALDADRKRRSREMAR